ncbi:MAG: mannose-phosphate guanylyltransferase [Thermoproteota archaeon]|nr:mannose-phosphate guanylyltransferase [Thermoproteota archaeon]
MRALILAGGFGTRLRPLSCTRPKLMFPIANRPLLDWVLERLSKSGVTRVVLAVNYMADVLRENFGKSKYGLEIVYSLEKKPLGTGGPIKMAEKFLGDTDEPFFVLNGDILSSMDYSELLAAHTSHKADATLALHEVDDPSRFGVVEMNGNEQILRFVEKPKKEEAPSKLVNAGVYVLNHTVFDLIPSDRKVSIEREVFPVLAGSGGLYGHKFNGVWIDIGKPSDYIQANKIVLDEIASEKPFLGKGAKVRSRVKIIPPVAIGSGAIIEDDVCIGPYVSIGNDVTVGKGSRIQDSVIYSKAWIDKFSSIKGAIIGEGAIIGSWVKVEEQCIVGDHAVINDNVTLTQKVQICPSKEVDASIFEPSTVM